MYRQSNFILINLLNSQNYNIMKTINDYKEIKRTEKAILISALLEETGKEESFWLQLSKIEIKNNSIEVQDDFWKLKLSEITEQNKNIVLKTPTYEKGDKATKVSIDFTIKDYDNAHNLWLFIPNEYVLFMQGSTDEEENPIFEVTMPKWVYENGIKSAFKYQLDNFWNKDKAEDQKLNIEDFHIINRAIL